MITLGLAGYGLYQGLFVAPADYQQGESYRIIFIHVPAASMSMMAYTVLAVAAFVSLVWKMKMGEIVVSAAAPIGAAFAVIALATGSIWGKPMWGTWWEWDARLTSELILLFLYLGIIALEAAIEDERVASKAASILALVGVVNLPIIHYSVTWWNTLHQPPSGGMIIKSSIDPSMRPALYAMMFAFMFYFFTVLMMRARSIVLRRERRSRWVREALLSSPSSTGENKDV